MVSKKLIILLFMCGLFAKSNTTVNGNVNYYFMTRLSNSEIINIPFRLLNINVYHQRENIDVNGTFSIEYRPRIDSDFIEGSDPSDFNLLIRELYLTYYLNNLELSLGKKIYTWGNVDDNSPIDNLNPYDYYYLLQGTSERKLGIYSISFDWYLDETKEGAENDFRLTGFFSPLHNTSRFPIDDPYYPMGLEIPEDIVPPSSKTTAINEKRPFESGLTINKSFINTDFSISYINSFDRIFNVSGFNIFQNNFGSVTSIQPLYSYRRTEGLNFGGVILLDDFTIRFDKTFFNSKDINNDLSFLESIESINQTTPSLEYSLLLNEKIRYAQDIIQIELPLPNDYQVNFQYFKHKTIRYQNVITEGGFDCQNISITNVSFDCDLLPSKENYIIGMGAPFSLLSHNLFVIGLEKTLLDNSLKLTFNAAHDLKFKDQFLEVLFFVKTPISKIDEYVDDNGGTMYSMEAEYEVNDNFEFLIGFTKIIGNSSLGDSYRFNGMESFSHLRTEINYKF